MNRLAPSIFSAFLLGGCSVDAPFHTGPVQPGSIVHDGTARIDLRHRPTREDLGFQPGRDNRSYQRGHGRHAIATTVVLPTGSLHVPAFVVSADSGDPTANAQLPPRHIVLQRLFDRSDEALRSLIADAATLGFHQDDVRDLLARVGATAGTPTPQQGVLNGFVKDWLASSAEVIGYEDGTVGVNYKFTVDQFHNDAIDRVVQDGVFPIDLTHRPSREELAFRDSDRTARVRPAWNTSLTAKLILPDGVIQRRVTSVDSTATQTVVSLAPSSVEDAQRALAADAPVLGVAPSKVDALFAGRPGHFKAGLHGLKTPFHDATITIDATRGQPGAFAAAVSYTFTYH